MGLIMAWRTTSLELSMTLAILLRTGSDPASNPTQSEASATVHATAPILAGELAASCDSLIVNKNSWTGNMQGKLKTVLKADISSYTIILQTDVSLTNIQFWEADATPTTGNSFTITNKNWFGGKNSGETLELGFQITFAGSTNPGITSITLNGVQLC